MKLSGSHMNAWGQGYFRLSPPERVPCMVIYTNFVLNNFSANPLVQISGERLQDQWSSGLSKRKGSVQLKETQIHIWCSVRCFQFYSKQEAAMGFTNREYKYKIKATINSTGIQIKKKKKKKRHNLAYLIIKMVKYYPLLFSLFFVLYHFKLDFYNKISFLQLSSANWIFTIKHVRFTYNRRWLHFDAACQFEFDQSYVNFIWK